MERVSVRRIFFPKLIVGHKIEAVQMMSQEGTSFLKRRVSFKFDIILLDTIAIQRTRKVSRVGRTMHRLNMSERGYLSLIVNRPSNDFRRVRPGDMGRGAKESREPARSHHEIFPFDKLSSFLNGIAH